MPDDHLTSTSAAAPAAHGETHPTSDVVADAVARVREDIEARRARGELPEFTPHEMRRHFDAVVEAYEGMLVEVPPLEFDSIREGRTLTGVVPSTSNVPGGSALHKVVAKVVGRQIQGMAQQMRNFGSDLVDRMQDLDARQERMRKFLLVAHLDRVRQLEYRVAQLELELERTRSRDADGPFDSAG